MKTLFYLPAIAMLFFLYSCNMNEEKAIVKSSDYERFLTKKINIHEDKYQQEIDFWQERINNGNVNHLYLMQIAGQKAARFKKYGNIKDIHDSDSLYYMANEIVQGNQAGIYQALAVNAITQHQFSKAMIYTQKAEKLGDRKYITTLMQADIQLELGAKLMSKKIISQLSHQDNFDVLIRKVKIKDQEGDLKGAIALMEKAIEKVKYNPKSPLHTWALSNLADMYGHAGRVGESYQAYLNVLQADPNFYYALKGIAWVAFSHDKNTTEARRILNYIQKKGNQPDIDLLLAEIADYEGNIEEKNRLLNNFKKEVQKPEYGEMYNKYLIVLEAEDFKNYDKALEIAQKEIKNRSTTQSYDLLAWVYYCKGDYQKALKTAQNYVEDATTEPEALLHLGKIYQAVGEKKKSRKFLKEALESAYELGPLKSLDIEKELK